MAIARKLASAWLFALAAAVLSFGQPAAKKATAPTSKKATAAVAEPDNRERSKECALQAEKMMAAFKALAVSAGTDRAYGRNNHYSPKYNRCSVRAFYSPLKTVTGGRAKYRDHHPPRRTRHGNLTGDAAIDLISGRIVNQ
jgi:hypothetical protein